jgi:hypothetical protein
VSSTSGLDTRAADALGTTLGHGGETIPTMLYTAKCFWPGVTEDELRVAAKRARSETAERPQTVFQGALFLPGDELVLCLFDSSSSATVKDASERAGMPCERVIETVWVAPHSRGGKGICED